MVLKARHNSGQPADDRWVAGRRERGYPQACGHWRRGPTGDRCRVRDQTHM